MKPNEPMPEPQDTNPIPPPPGASFAPTAPTLRAAPPTEPAATAPAAPAPAAPVPSAYDDHPLLGNTDVPKLQPFSPKPQVTAPPASAPVPAQSDTPIAAAFSPQSGDAGNPPAPQPLTAFASDGFGGPVIIGQKKSRKFIFGIIALFVVLIGGIGGYVFGYYLPNMPENVFKTGLDRTGMASEKLSEAATEKSKLDTIKSMEVTGSINVKGPDGTHKGTFSSRSDDRQSDSELSYTPVGTPEAVKLEVLTDLAEGQTYPDSYLRLTGLTALGLDELFPPLAAYENRWIHASPSTLESMYSVSGSEQDEITDQDIAELADIAVKTSREYIFTTDPAKNVLVQKEFVGKEQVEGETAYRYKVGIHKQHLNDLCKAAAERFISSRAFQKLSGLKEDDLEDSKKQTIEDCKEASKGIKDSDTFDMWINQGNKLISKIRLADSEDKNTYVELGQKYVSGNKIPMYVRFYSDRDNYDVKVTVDVNIDAATFKATTEGEFEIDEEKWSLGMELESKPYKGDVSITKPSDTVPIEEFLSALGLDWLFGMGIDDSAASSTSLGGIQAKSKDTERQTDLKALQGQLEAYYAQNGEYPTTTQINDPRFIAENMKGLDIEATRDPDGSKYEFTNRATKGQYGYYAIGCLSTGGGCTAYTLTATMSDGEMFTLQSLN